jgi:Skp family chaperone for outer membrane proteins
LWFVPQVVLAADVPTAYTSLKIGVLDIDKILHESLVGKFIQEQVDNNRAELQKEIEGHEANLREDEKQLRELQAKEGTTADELRAKQATFEGKVANIQTAFAAKKQALEEAFNGARSEVIQMIMKLVSEIADERKITLVIPKNVVMFRDDTYEFTDELMNRLNKRMPTVKINLRKRA